MIPEEIFCEVLKLKPIGTTRFKNENNFDIYLEHVKSFTQSIPHNLL